MAKTDGLQGMEEDGDGEGGEPDQNVKMQVSGKRGKGRSGQGISPEELRRLLERGAQIRPVRIRRRRPRAARGCI